MGTDGLASLQAQGTEGGRPWIDRLYGTSSALATRLSLVVVGVVGGVGVPKCLGTASAPQFSILLEVCAGGVCDGAMGTGQASSVQGAWAPCGLGTGGCQR